MIVHEWNEPALVAAHRRGCGGAAARFTLLFHDTHHRAVSDPDAIRALRPRRLRRRARLRRGARARSTAAGAGATASSPGTRPPTSRLFRPPADEAQRDGLVWIGNWGDDERSARAATNSCSSRRRRPACALDVHGVRYPDAGAATCWPLRRALSRLAAERRGAARSSPAISRPSTCRAASTSRRCPASRPSASSRRWPAASRWSRAPWERRGGPVPARRRTYLVARDGAEMTRHLARAARRPGAARRARRAAASRRSARRHTCAHRVDELLAIVAAPRRRREPIGGCPHEDRLLRLEPAVVLLERRRDLLPRHAPRPRARAATTSPSTSPTPTTASSTATSSRRTGPTSSSTRRPTEALRARHRRGGAAPTWSSRRAASACSTTSCSTGVIARRAARTRSRIFWDVDAPATLAELRGDPDHPLRRALPALDLVLTYGGGAAGGRRLRELRRAALRADLQRARSRARIIPVPPEPRFAADLAFLGNRLPDREARVEEFFLEPRRALPERALPARRQRLGRQGDAGQRAPPRPCLHARAQRLQLHAARGAERRPRQHGRRSASRRRRASSRRPAPAPA